MAIYEYLTLNGIIVPDTDQILFEVQQEYKDGFNDQTLAVTPDTPQGVLITAETESRISIARNNAALANQINPNYAGGIFLDAIWALLGGERLVQTFTTVLVNLTGVQNTLIPSDVLLTNTDGDIFQIFSSINLDDFGLGQAYFIAQQGGPIPALAGNVSTIYRGVLGLETATNPNDGILGVETESDDLARKRRNNTLALQGSASLEAISSGLYDIQSVTSLRALENPTASVVIVEGVTMQPHSFYFSVAGGTDLDVATTIFNKKSGGAGYTNSASSSPVTVNIEGPYGVIYPVSFDRPDQLQILVKVTVRPNNTPIDITTAVRQAVLDYARGFLPYDLGLTVGTTVSAFQIGGAVKIQIPTIEVVKVETTLASLINYDTAEIPIAVWQQAIIAGDSSITVVIL
jgi:hypothetical protein